MARPKKYNISLTDDELKGTKICYAYQKANKPKLFETDARLSLI